MSDYEAQTVTQLREVLKSRNLATEGLKNELVERLVKDDVEKTKVGDDDKKQDVKEDEGKTETGEKPEETKHEEKKEDPKVDEKPVAEGAGNPVDKPQDNTQKDYKEMAIELLRKKLHRAKKFGQDQEQIDSLNRMVVRIEKFGLDPSMPVAQEVGMAKPKAAGASRQGRNRNREKSKKLSRKSHRRK